ncbi:MAG: Lpg1974 family pore-forming outer membrane protein [Candidatus Omnitrophica bacterium]|nr:Lpg1974 family pore-forming outer membrane protein [Candidatus Omnitrophota bacterium]
MKKIILSLLINILFLPLFSYAASIGGTYTQGGALGGALIGVQQQANQQGNDTDPARSSQPPRWTVSAEAIVFDRVGTAKQTLVERVPGTVPFEDVPTTTGTPALNSTDLNQGFSPGFRLGAVYHVDSNYDLEASFFHINDLSSTRSIGPDNPLNWLVIRAPGGFFQTQDFSYQSMTWGYSTELYNAELNVQKKISNRITVLAGFRWLQLYENLQGTIPPADIFKPTWKSTNPGYTLNDVANITTGITAPAYPPFWDTSTTNNLYGLQIGADGKLLERGHFSLNGLIKVGGYCNHASESTGVSIAKIVYKSGVSTNHAAFVGEAGLQCKYQVTSRLTLKLGYEALWLDGVALAPGQIQETYSTFAPVTVTARGVNSDSNVLFQGATAGLEFSF